MIFTQLTCDIWPIMLYLMAFSYADSVFDISFACNLTDSFILTHIRYRERIFEKVKWLFLCYDSICHSFSASESDFPSRLPFG